MPGSRTDTEYAAGKLIAAIQKEWIGQLGEPDADVSENVMNSAHELLAAAKSNSLIAILAGRTVSDFLSTVWVKQHPSVLPAIQALEAAIATGEHA